MLLQRFLMQSLLAHDEMITEEGDRAAIQKTKLNAENKTNTAGIEQNKMYSCNSIIYLR